MYRNIITESLKAKTVLELANGPIKADGEELLLQEKVTILPDVLANAGGVTVSYVEWIQGKTGEVWDSETVQKKLKTILINKLLR